MPRTGWVFLVISMLAPHAARGEMAAALAPKTWERDADGKWVQVEDRAIPPTAAARTPTTGPSGDYIENPTLDRIEQQLAARRYRSAREPILRWIKDNIGAPDRDRGLFLLAEMYNQAGDKIRAFYHLDELMDYYPESRLFYPALEKQFAIADRFLKGHKRKFLGIPLLTTDDEGIEILFRIQERAPGSPIAERSLLRTADHYYDTSQFDLAADAYASYARSYPRSPDVARVRLRAAFASLAQFRGLRFDATPVIDAKAQLEDIQAEYPQLAQRENVADVLERIEGILAARVATTADFYRRTHEPQAAVYNWRYLVENFPDTAEADRARKELERAPAWALELPAPTGGRATEAEQLRTPTPKTENGKTGGDSRGTGEAIPPSIDTPRDKTQ
jgi:outer membrane assembly lipoprotein YfiO